MNPGGSYSKERKKEINIKNLILLPAKDSRC